MQAQGAARLEQVTRSTHLPVLDILRGQGALLVLALHIHCVEPRLAFGERGYLAVELLFILSGFVIGMRYGEELETGYLDPRRYLAIRLVRFYPLILLGLVLGGWSFANAMPEAEIFERSAAQAAMLPTLWLTGHLFVINAPQWSLFFELLANGIHAFAAKVLRLPVLVVIVAVSGALFLVAILHYGSVDIGADRHSFPGGFPRVAFGFFGGLLLHRLWQMERLPALRGGAIGGILALPGLLLGATLIPFDRALVEGVIAIAALPIILLLAVGGTLSTGWHRLAAWGGAISYPLYAVHAPLVLLAQAWSAPRGLPTDVLPLFWLTISIGIVAVAAMANRFYDRPMRAALTVLSGLPQRRRVGPAAAQLS